MSTHPWELLCDAGPCSFGYEIWLTSSREWNCSQLNLMKREVQGNQHSPLRHFESIDSWIDYFLHFQRKRSFSNQIMRCPKDMGKESITYLFFHHYFHRAVVSTTLLIDEQAYGVAYSGSDDCWLTGSGRCLCYNCCGAIDGNDVGVESPRYFMYLKILCWVFYTDQYFQEKHITRTDSTFALWRLQKQARLRSFFNTVPLKVASFFTFTGR